MITRLVIYIVTKRWGIMLIGALVMVGGLIFGSTSHQVAYKQVDQATISHYLSGEKSDDSYIQLSDGSLYFFNEKNLSPAFNANLLQSRKVSLVYDSTETKSIDIKSSNTSTHLNGSGSQIVKITTLDGDGQNPKAYTTDEYTKNPQGFYRNNWTPASMVILLGLAVVCLAVFVRRNKAQPQAGYAAPGVPSGQPQSNQFTQYPQPYQGPGQEVNPYQQAYQGPSQYPQATQYPAQPSNPQQAPGAPPYYPPQQ